MMTLTTMGGIPFHVVEYTAAVPAVSHATPPQHAWALTAGSNSVVKLLGGRVHSGWCRHDGLAALCCSCCVVIARLRSLGKSFESLCAFRAAANLFPLSCGTQPRPAVLIMSSGDVSTKAAQRGASCSRVGW